MKRRVTDWSWLDRSWSLGPRKEEALLLVCAVEELWLLRESGVQGNWKLST